MEQIKLELQLRKKTGSGVTGRLRGLGMIPAVVYGGDEAPVPVQVRKADFERIMRSHIGESVLFSISLVDEGKVLKDFIALVKATQYNPVSDFTDHLDFQRVSMDKEISIRIPIKLKGEAVGLKKPGATLEHHLREIEVICLPKDIPGHIEVDVSKLDALDSVHVSELVLGPGVRTKADPDTVVAAVVFAMREDAPLAAAEGEVAKAEPEVLKEKPKEEKAAEGGAKSEGGAAKK
jgi:large subunit ribosomal protein L25